MRRACMSDLEHVPMEGFGFNIVQKVIADLACGFDGFRKILLLL